MLVIGTKPEYFDAVWVKNEWSRFMKLMKNDRSKMLIPCYRDMDAYDLPEEFAHLQAQDMSKIGFINDVVRGIKKVIAPEKENKSKQADETVNSEMAPTVSSLLKRVAIFLEDGKPQDANAYCEKVLDLDPENGQAYLYKLLVDVGARNTDDLAKSGLDFESNGNYQKVLRYGNTSTKELVGNCLKSSREVIEYNNKQVIYNSAVKRMNSTGAPEELLALADTFRQLGNFQDSNKQAELCYKKAEDLKKEKVYQQAIEKRNHGGFVIDDIAAVEKAIEMFQSISGYKDSDEQINLCYQKIEEIKEARIERQRKEEEDRKALAEAKVKRAKIRLIVLIIIAICLAIILIVINAIEIIS